MGGEEGGSALWHEFKRNVEWLRFGITNFLFCCGLELKANSTLNLKILTMYLALGPPIPNPRPNSIPNPSIQTDPKYN